MLTLDGKVAPIEAIDGYPDRLFTMQPVQRVAGVSRKVVGNEVRFRQHGIVGASIGKAIVITPTTVEERLLGRRSVIPLSRVRGFAAIQHIEWRGDRPTWITWGCYAWLETEIVWLFAFGGRFDQAADFAIQLNHAAGDVIQPAHAQHGLDRSSVRNELRV